MSLAERALALAFDAYEDRDADDAGLPEAYMLATPAGQALAALVAAAEMEHDYLPSMLCGHPVHAALDALREAVGEP